MTHIKEFFTKLSESSSNQNISNIPKKKKKLFLALFATLLVVAAVIGIVAGVNSRKNSGDNGNEPHHAILKSSCSSTRYPDLCFSAIAAVPEASKKVTSQKDVIEMSLNITTTAVEHNYFGIQKLLKRTNLTKREKVALHDCLETIDETLDELHKAVEDLEEYPNKKSLSQHADDLKTLMSAAMTNQGTCLDGFSHDDANKHVRDALSDGQVHVEKMCSNALAMIKNMTDTDMMIMRTSNNRKLIEETSTVDGWPAWLSPGDRRLLQSSSVTPNVVVAADGSGNFKTVAAAVAAAPQGGTKRYIIRIKAGVYRENVEVTKKHKNIMFIGDGRTRTIITGSRNVVDGSTTFKSATVGKSTFH